MNEKNTFECLGCKCPNHCCAAYDGISDKLTPMSGVDVTEIILTDEDRKRIIDAGRKDLVIDNEEIGISRIKTAKDGTCAALCDGRCLIYNARPAICRAYPLYLDMFTGLCYVNDCEAFKKALPMDIKDLDSEIEQLLDIYQFWIDTYRKKLEQSEGKKL